jgi:hypothetical protein
VIHVERLNSIAERSTPDANSSGLEGGPCARLPSCGSHQFTILSGGVLCGPSELMAEMGLIVKPCFCGHVVPLLATMFGDYSWIPAASGCIWTGPISRSLVLGFCVAIMQPASGTPILRVSCMRYVAAARNSTGSGKIAVAAGRAGARGGPLSSSETRRSEIFLCAVYPAQLSGSRDRFVASG